MGSERGDGHKRLSRPVPTHQCDPPAAGKRRFGYSRDKRSDCVQVVIALIVTPDGLPLAYEVMPGNTADKATLRDFIQRIEAQYGKVGRTWVMDRGIPTEEVLAEMRASEVPLYYLVGTPRGRLSQMERDFLPRPWTAVRASVQVKLVEQDSELYILARSGARRDKEQAMRRRRLKKLVKRLHELRQQKLTRDQLLIKLGVAKKETGPAAYRIIDIQLPDKDQPVTPETFNFRLNWQRLREARRREGSYLLRSNLTDSDPAKLWTFYLQLIEVEQAFKELKGDLAIRPIYHQTDARIDAHVFVAFMAYCLQITLKQRLRSLASGLTPRSVLDKMAAIQMVDVHLPTTDGRTVVLSRYTEPAADQAILLQQLKISLPAQPPPRITAAGVPGAA
jgi:transposase